MSSQEDGTDPPGDHNGSDSRPNQGSTDPQRVPGNDAPFPSGTRVAERHQDQSSTVDPPSLPDAGSVTPENPARAVGPHPPDDDEPVAVPEQTKARGLKRRKRNPPNVDDHAYRGSNVRLNPDLNSIPQTRGVAVLESRIKELENIAAQRELHFKTEHTKQYKHYEDQIKVLKARLEDTTRATTSSSSTEQGSQGMASEVTEELESRITALNQALTTSASQYKSEIATLRQDIESLKEENEERTQEARRKEDLVRAAEEDLDRSRKLHQEAEAKERSLLAKIDELDNEVAVLKKSTENANNTRLKYEQQAETAQEQLNGLETELQELQESYKALLDRAHATQSDASNRLASATAERKHLETQLNEALLNAEHLQEQLNNMAAKCDDSAGALESAQTRITRLESDLAKAAGTMKDRTEAERAHQKEIEEAASRHLETVRSKLEQELVRSQTEVDAFRAEAAKAGDESQQAHGKAQELQLQLQQAESALRQANHDANDAKVQLAEAQSVIANYEERLRTLETESKQRVASMQQEISRIADERDSVTDVRQQLQVAQDEVLSLKKAEADFAQSVADERRKHQDIIDGLRQDLQRSYAEKHDVAAQLLQLQADLSTQPSINPYDTDLGQQEALDKLQAHCQDVMKDLERAQDTLEKVEARHHEALTTAIAGKDAVIQQLQQAMAELDRNAAAATNSISELQNGMVEIQTANEELRRKYELSLKQITEKNTGVLQNVQAAARRKQERDDVEQNMLRQQLASLRSANEALQSSLDTSSTDAANRVYQLEIEWLAKRDEIEKRHSNTLKDLESQHTALQKTLEIRTRDLQSIQLDLRRAKDTEEQLRERIAQLEPISDSLPDDHASHNPPGSNLEVTRLRQEVALLESRIQRDKFEHEAQLASLIQRGRRKGMGRNRKDSESVTAPAHPGPFTSGEASHRRDTPQLPTVEHHFVRTGRQSSPSSLTCGQSLEASRTGTGTPRAPTPSQPSAHSCDIEVGAHSSDFCLCSFHDHHQRPSSRKSSASRRTPSASPPPHLLPPLTPRSSSDYPRDVTEGYNSESGRTSSASPPPRLLSCLTAQSSSAQGVMEGQGTERPQTLVPKLDILSKTEKKNVPIDNASMKSSSAQAQRRAVADAQNAGDDDVGVPHPPIIQPKETRAMKLDDISIKACSSQARKRAVANEEDAGDDEVAVPPPLIVQEKKTKATKRATDDASTKSSNALGRKRVVAAEDDLVITGAKTKVIKPVKADTSTSTQTRRRAVVDDDEARDDEPVPPPPKIQKKKTQAKKSAEESGSTKTSGVQPSRHAVADQDEPGDDEPQVPPPPNIQKRTKATRSATDDASTKSSNALGRKRVVAAEDDLVITGAKAKVIKSATDDGSTKRSGTQARRREAGDPNVIPAVPKQSKNSQTMTPAKDVVPTKSSSTQASNHPLADDDELVPPVPKTKKKAQTTKARSLPAEHITRRRISVSDFSSTNSESSTVSDSSSDEDATGRVARKRSSPHSTGVGEASSSSKPSRNTVRASETVSHNTISRTDNGSTRYPGTSKKSNRGESVNCQLLDHRPSMTKESVNRVTSQSVVPISRARLEEEDEEALIKQDKAADKSHPKEKAKYRELVRTAINNLLGIKECKDAHLLRSASAEHIAAYERDRSKSPDPAAPLLDFIAPLSSAWNKEVMHILFKHIQRQLEKHPRGSMPERSDPYLRDVIQGILTRAKTTWTAHRPKTVEDRLETPVEVALRVEASRRSGLLKNRMRSRRTGRFKSRMETVDYMIEKAREDGDKMKLALWKFMRELLLELTQDGMSSDESDGADYKVHVLLWRREDATLCLDEIDRHRKTTRNPQGPNAHKRNRCGNVISSRPPPKGLSEIIFKPGWLAQLSEVEFGALKVVVDGEFRWMNIFT